MTQPWYYDDDGAGIFFPRIQFQLEDCMVRGPYCRYFPDLTKSIFIDSDKNVPWDQAFFGGAVICMVKGGCYLGGVIGEA